jgi:lipopolysaccharide transport system permease protein
MLADSEQAPSRRDHHSTAALVKGILRQRELLRELVRRDLHEAYAGSVLARSWALLHPILLIALYLYVFGFVFSTRVGGYLPEAPDFAVFMLSGLACWLTVQAALGKATNSLLASSNLVKQVVFPIELLPVRSVIAAQLPVLIGLFLVIIYSFIRFQILSPLIPLALYVLAAQAVLLVGLTLFLSALTVFIRDVKDIVTFFAAFGVFLTPIIYLPGTVPVGFEMVLFLNPLSHAIWCLQDIFFFQSIQHPWSWLLLGFFAVLFFWVGARFFQRTRDSFGDAL